MFRRPDDDEDFSASRVVKAKPIAEKYAKKLGTLAAGKDFYKASADSQQAFYGSQEMRTEEETGSRSLTEDDRNKISAKILKAELKGDKELVEKLKAKLASGTTEGSSKDKEVVLLKRDRQGNILPASSRSSDLEKHAQGSSRMRREYEKDQSMKEMLREEKNSTAEDQNRLFENSLVKSSKIRRHDDESLDDIAEMQKGRRKTDEKAERKKEKRAIQEHRKVERSLDDCSRCIDGSKLAKHNVVAIGMNTYLAVVEWDGLDTEHCIIVPTSHASSTIQLDENVWDEMRIWRKGLVAMWKEQDRDCIFMEMARNVQTNPHVIVECVPVPQEIGDLAPIYFKKAINECEGEYTDNKKLIETKDLRYQIPKGFSYFAVDFGLSNGYAHVIENPELFSANFGTEIIAGMLDLSHKKWRKRENLELAEQKKNASAMKALWEPYDWTKRLRMEDLSDEQSSEKPKKSRRDDSSDGEVEKEKKKKSKKARRDDSSDEDSEKEKKKKSKKSKKEKKEKKKRRDRSSS